MSHKLLRLSGLLTAGLLTIATPALAVPKSPVEEPLPEIQLSSEQKDTILQIGDLAIDQIETLIKGDFDPNKIDRATVNERGDTLRDLLTSIRPDDRQKDAFITILRRAREQMQRQLETAPTR